MQTKRTRLNVFIANFVLTRISVQFSSIQVSVVFLCLFFLTSYRASQGTQDSWHCYTL